MNDLGFEVDKGIAKDIYEKGYADGRAKMLMPYDVESIDDLIENVRAKVIDEVKGLIKSKLVDSLALENATKYGNKNAKQQANSYATVMKYEIADCVEDLLDDLENLKEQK